MRRSLIIAIVAVFVAAIAAVYYFFDPSQIHIFPRCVVKVLTGYDCPGCGSQRALHALLHGNLAEAWHYNAGLMVILPLIAAYVVADFNRGRWPRFYLFLNGSTVIWFILLFMVGWTVLRNIIGW